MSKMPGAERTKNPDSPWRGMRFAVRHCSRIAGIAASSKYGWCTFVGDVGDCGFSDSHSGRMVDRSKGLADVASLASLQPGTATE